MWILGDVKRDKEQVTDNYAVIFILNKRVGMRDKIMNTEIRGELSTELIECIEVEAVKLDKLNE